MAKTLDTSVAPETLAKFKGKITELEDMADEELHTHLAEDADKMARGLYDEETNE